MENKKCKTKGLKTIKVLRERKYKAGYVIRDEIWDDDCGCGPTEMKKQAYNLNDEWIGNSKRAYKLIVQKGIMPEKIAPDHCSCTIGFCEKEQKWYGWSHRAICGFGIGYEVKEGSLCATSGWTQEYLDKHPEEDKRMPVGFIAKTLDDCKRLAIAFNESVS